MSHFRQLLTNIDVRPLLAQLHSHPELWHNQTEWTANKAGSAVYETENIVLRYNKSTAPGRDDWDRPPFGILSAAQKIIFDVMHAIPGEHLGKVVITRMKPGQKIDWHVDRMPPGRTPYFQRYQIPLSVATGVRFVVGEEEQYMAPGTAWWFDNQIMHAVFNESDEDRISMLTDIRPFTVSRLA